jgi:N-acetylneuraminic acid mutarotase
MAVAREHIATASAGGRLFVFGGRAGGRNLSDVERFDPGNNRWSRLPPLRVKRSGIAAATVSSRIAVFGGEQLSEGARTIRPVELFNPAARRWTRLPGMLTPRHGLGGAALGRRIYALEGGPRPGFAFSRKLESLDVPPGPQR